MLDHTDMKPALQSMGVLGGIAAIAGPLLGFFGYSISPEDVGDLPVFLGMIVGGVGGVFGIWGRVRASKRIGSQP